MSGIRLNPWAGALVSALGVIAAAGPVPAQSRDNAPDRVTFLSADGRTTLVGYLYQPAIAAGARVPAVVMMHGRSGAYSRSANGRYDASTLSLRHRAWGRKWAAAGYIALLVDGFGPRGYPQGFPRFSYDFRPAAVNEVTVRPLDAYGALAYLHSRSDVVPDRIGLQGWSNGGSAAIAAIDAQADSVFRSSQDQRFRAALVLYPACRLKGGFEKRPFRPYAPTLILHGTADQEVSSRRCAGLVERSRAAGGNVSIHFYPGATHGFDSPTRKRQEANATAANDAMMRSQRFFARHLGSDNSGGP